jgi:beta-lactam-binding protein with PASTA domain
VPVQEKRPRNENAGQSRRADDGREASDEDEMRRRGRSPKKGARRRGSTSWLPSITGATLALIIVIAVSFAYVMLVVMGENDAADNTETVPNLIGRDINEVIEEMRDGESDLRWFTYREIRFENNANFAENEIISHTPVAGDVRRWLGPGNEIGIDFRVSKGRYTYIVEDLAVRAFRRVELDLEGRQIRVLRVDQLDDFVPRGYIISTDPGPGTVLRAGDTITVYVSSGQEIRRVLMPRVIGTDLQEARGILFDAEINIRGMLWEHSDIVPAGYVIEQSIPPFRSVPARSTRITLTVSLGPESPLMPYPAPERDDGDGDAE